MTVRVVTAEQAAALDKACVEGGNPSRALMQRAGAAAAGEITRRYPSMLAHGVAVYAGPGNNGGDAWVVAGALATQGITVRLREAVPAATDDAIAEKARTLACVSFNMPIGTERIIVDGLLGTGATGSPRGAIGDAVSDIVRMRNEGAVVVALDVPSGLDASSGESDQGVRADLTISFGTAKFGQLLRRSHCGTVVVVDIGLGDLSQKDDSLPLLVSGSWVREHIPSISAEAHKGERRRVAIVGGSAGMAGAVALAAQGSLRSGAGLISVVVHPDSIPALQASVPQAIAAAWPGSGSEAEGSLGKWAHCVVLGPGLGTDSTSRAVAAHVLGLRSTPLVIDADALNILASESNALANAGMGRAAVLTPHAGEMARLMNVTVEEVLAHRVELAAELARRTGAAVLLKGVPSVIASPSGRINVSAAGSPALATGGSGDVLSGLLGTLLAQTGDPFIAASCAAWLHGRAGEMAAATHGVRGATLSTVLDSLDGAFAGSEPWAPYPVLAELPAIS